MKTMIIFLILLPLFSFADWKVLREGESDDCYLSWLEDHQGHTFVLKQIKDPDPSEQFLLVVDAVANQIGHRLGIPVNQVKMIPAHQPFPGKRIQDYPATLHTEAPGKSTEESLPWKGFTIHQRYQPASSWTEKKWGPLPDSKKGLTIEVMEQLFLHPDLQKIVALDTFLGNSDRSLPNIFYNIENDRFYGIDMAASFRPLLAKTAYDQIIACKLESTKKINLALYRKTLQQLYDRITPELTAELLDSVTAEAGFYDQNHLNVPAIFERSSFHKERFKKNYQWIPILITLLNPTDNLF